MNIKGKEYEQKRLSPRHDGSYEDFAWQASYSTSVYSQSAKTEMSIPYEIEGTRTKECPVSLITPESRQLVENLAQAEWIKQASGFFPGGADPDKWDARYFDFVRIWKMELARCDNARDDAERRVS